MKNLCRTIFSQIEVSGAKSAFLEKEMDIKTHKFSLLTVYWCSLKLFMNSSGDEKVKFVKQVKVR